MPAHPAPVGDEGSRSAAAVRRERDHRADRCHDDGSHDDELPPAVHDLGGGVAEDSGDDGRNEAENERAAFGAAANSLRATAIEGTVVLVALVDGHVGHAVILLVSTR